MSILPYTGTGYTPDQLRELVKQMEKLFPALVAKFKLAFMNKTLIYGTSGRGGGTAKLANIMRDAINKGVILDHIHVPQNGSPRWTNEKNVIIKPPKIKKAAIFQAGVRGMVQKDHNLQMMDMYYGDKEWGGDLAEKADKDILAFIVYAIKLRFLPGWESFKDKAKRLMGSKKRKIILRNTLDRLRGRGAKSQEPQPYEILKEEYGIEKGYMPHDITTEMYGMDDFGQMAMTATKEISRIVRWGVAEFGGTIIFEGAEVFYDQVFSKKPKLADTDLEARTFFQYFKPNQSGADIGNGQVIFHWGGKRVVPSKLLFLTSWQWSKWGGEQWYKIQNPEAYNTEVLGNFRGRAPGHNNMGAKEEWEKKFEQGQRFGGPTYAGGGGVAPTRKATEATGRNDSILNFRKAMENLKSEIGYKDLWANFSDLPPGIVPAQIPRWLDSL